MGTCTSSIKHRQKRHRQLHKQTILENAAVLENKQLSSLPSTVLPNPYLQQTSLTNSEVHSSSFIEPTSLIQLYTSNTNNNNNNNCNINNNSMSSSSSSPSKVPLPPPRVPLTKSRLPVHQPSASSSRTGSTKPKNIPVTIGTTNPPGNPSSFKCLQMHSLYTYSIYMLIVKAIPV